MQSKSRLVSCRCIPLNRWKALLHKLPLEMTRELVLSSLSMAETVVSLEVNVNVRALFLRLVM